MRRVSKPLLVASVLLGGAGLAAGLLLTESSPAPGPGSSGAATDRSAGQARHDPARSPAEGRAEAVALQSLRARQREPETVMFRDVRVWQFGPANERAVCGIVEARDLPGGAAPFVVRVVLPGDSAMAPLPGRPAPGQAAAPAMPILEDGPGMTRPQPEARRRYCRDAADEAPAPSSPPVAPPAAAAGVVAPPPAPSIPAQQATAATDPAAPAAPTGERVTTASHANLRSGPMSGEVLSVIPRGTVLSVFGRAPGGWVRVGEGEPWGWIHGSMLAEGAGPPQPR